MRWRIFSPRRRAASPPWEGSIPVCFRASNTRIPAWTIRSVRSGTAQAGHTFRREPGDPETLLQVPTVFRPELVSSLGQDRDEAVYGFLRDGQCSGLIRHVTLTPDRSVTGRHCWSMAARRAAADPADRVPPA